MTQRHMHTLYSCPRCGAALARDNGVLRCEAHGAFFTYGPQLLVRVPHSNGKLSDTALPWEGRKPRAQR
jgi:uncharacterized Zn finger protein (UPF0148 family)